MVKQLDRAQEIESPQAKAAGRQPAVQEFRPSDGLPAYQLPGDGLSMGASLGNGHCWITTMGRGDIESFFSTDLGRIVMGGMQARYSGLGTSLLRIGDDADARDAYMQLRPKTPGTIEEFYPAVVKAAHHIVSQEDARGLVWCTSTGEDARGIIGWCNIIPHYRISGAITEVNAECAAALRAAGHLAENLGHQEEGREFRVAAARLIKECR